MEKRRAAGILPFREAQAARVKLENRCRRCGVVKPRKDMKAGRCWPCVWLDTKAAGKQRQRKYRPTEWNDGDKRRCRRCNLWKITEKHFSKMPGVEDRRRVCSACYSYAQFQRQKAAGIVREYANIDRDSWQEVLNLLGGLCAYCRKKPWTDREHIVPASKGGPTELWNLTIACRACNVRKKNNWGWFPTAVHPWMRPREFYEREAQAEARAKGLAESFETAGLDMGGER